MMTTEHLIVLSDLHITPPGPRQSFTGVAPLCDLISQHVLPRSTLVLAGDIFDLLHAAGRTDRLDWQNAPRLFDDFLRDLGTDGERLLKTLGAVLSRGARIVVMPGNHDAELYHPDCLTVLCQQIAAQDSTAPLHQLSLHTASTLDLRVGPHAVTIVHGHSQDPWNRFSEELLSQSQQGTRPSLPPGSRLVLRVMAPLQLDGEQRFHFLDKLKPENPLFFLLLILSIDWRLFRYFGEAVGLSAAMLLERLRLCLSSPTLAAAPAPSREPPGDEALSAALAHALAAAIPSGPERNSDALAVERWIRGQEPESLGAGTLPAYSGRRVIWKALLNGARGKRFFDRGHLDAADKALLAVYARRQGNETATSHRVLIAGHTHAARSVRTPDGVHYINTGTWTHLLPFGVPLPSKPATAEHDNFRDFKDTNEVVTWVDQLRARNVKDYCRYDYAEVNESGAVLRSRPIE